LNLMKRELKDALYDVVPVLLHFISDVGLESQEERIERNRGVS